jgi:hypothetical protein
VSHRNSLEQRALKILFEAGDEGIMQSELWKELGVSSREGSRLALRFEEKGSVERRKILHEGRWSFKLFSKREFVTMNSIEGCPCMICVDIDKCFESGVRDPVSCQDLTTWLTPRKAD